MIESNKLPTEKKALIHVLSQLENSQNGLILDGEHIKKRIANNKFGKLCKII